MNQLDNIECMFKEYNDEHVSDTVMFLVRAVRQLGKYYAIAGNVVITNIKLDDDVLTLIEREE